MITAKVSAVKLFGVAAVAMAFLCVAAVEAKAQPNKLGQVLPGAKPLTIYPGIGRYSIHPESKTWLEAHKTCSLENGHLVVINSEEEAALILEIMDANSKFDTLIGLYDLFAEGKFVSVRGQALETLGYQTWADGQPSGGTTKNYCAFRNAGAGAAGTGFYDLTASTQLPFICELPMWDDYELIPGQGYYKLHNGKRTWKESWETCRSEGGYLLLFASTIERDFVVSKYLSVVSDTRIWYGAHHAFANQKFITTFDESLEKSGFSTWMSGFPGTIANTGSPYLGLNMISDQNHDLVLVTSATMLPFICKHNLYDMA